MGFPFEEIQLSDNEYIRVFKADTPEEELVWHMDDEDRDIRPFEKTDWLFQFDNTLPIKMDPKRTIFIPRHTIHRVIKGKKPLILYIKKYGCNTKES